jgi:hypothetical protein
MSTPDPQLKNIKRLVWLYFWLLIFEGALRKWVVPQYSAPLLIVRDPVVLLIYILAIGRGLFPKGPFIAWIVLLAMLSFFASLAGIGTLKVTLFGLRTNFLHLPLIFLLPNVFDGRDVKTMGKWLMILSPPMALLALAQFRAAPDAWINAAAGGERGGQLYAAMGRIRPPGLFSFVTGMVSYLTFVTAFLFCHFLDGKIFRHILMLVSVPSLVLALGISGSRSAVAAVSIVFFMLVFICIRRGKLASGALKYTFVLWLVYFGMSYLPVFQQGMMVQRERFESGGGVHEGLVNRFVDELVNSFDACSTAPMLGLGLGLGTNAGAGMVSGERQFLLAEGEWGRVILESGPLLGIAFILLRLGILVHLWNASLRKPHEGSSLPLLLLSATGLDLLTGQFGQPTGLGFVVLGSGLCLASATRAEEALGCDNDPEPPSQTSVQEAKKMRGRSSYAETLHADT